MTVAEAALADGGGRRGVGLNLLRSEPRDLGADLHLRTDLRPYLDTDARTYDVVPHRNPQDNPLPLPIRTEDRRTIRRPDRTSILQLPTRRRIRRRRRLVTSRTEGTQCHRIPNPGTRRICRTVRERSSGGVKDIHFGAEWVRGWVEGKNWNGLRLKTVRREVEGGDGG